MIGANIKISLHHELAIIVLELDQGKGKLLNIENHCMSHENNMELRQFFRLAAKYTRAQTVFMIAADLYLFW